MGRADRNQQAQVGLLVLVGSAHFVFLALAGRLHGHSPRALARLADAGTVLPLTDFLKLGDRRVMRGAVEGLVAIGRPAVPLLAKWC